ncbi:MAG: hypothetical protein J7501_08125 [Bdellovibrio sp.]|nr:hypothetical protein [Bdellovibrio sp.]
MLRHILLAALLVFSSFAYAGKRVSASDESIMPTNDDRWTTWPWSLAQPFPWEDIQGLWKVETGDYVSYFAFKVVKQKTSGGRQLEVKQIDGTTRKVLATGPGFETGQMVLAQMTSCGGSTYRVRLTSFKPENSPQPPLMSNLYKGSVMVLSIGNLDAPADEMVDLQITKVSSRFRFNQESCSSK